jgi:uncharacterized protein HemX
VWASLVSAVLGITVAVVGFVYSQGQNAERNTAARQGFHDANAASQARHAEQEAEIRALQRDMEHRKDVDRYLCAERARDNRVAQVPDDPYLCKTDDGD